MHWIDWLLVLLSPSAASLRHHSRVEARRQPGKWPPAAAVSTASREKPELIS